MIPFIITAVFAFLIYLLFTAGTGTLGVWSLSELIMGALLSLLVGAVSRTFFCRCRDYRMVNPLRWILLMVYAVVPFFLEMARANVDVAYRVITGRIRPGIVCVTSDLKSDLGIVMLADSITLTPGTLTIDINEKTHDLYVHMINIPVGDEAKKEFRSSEFFSVANLPAWIRRIAE